MWETFQISFERRRGSYEIIYIWNEILKNWIFPKLSCFFPQFQKINFYKTDNFGKNHSPIFIKIIYLISDISKKLKKTCILRQNVFSRVRDNSELQVFPYNFPKKIIVEKTSNLELSLTREKTFWRNMQVFFNFFEMSEMRCIILINIGEWFFQTFWKIENLVLCIKRFVV